MSNNRFGSIIGYIDLIKSKPKAVSFFNIENIGRKFIVDGNKIKLLPPAYAKYAASDEFYMSVDVDKKEIIYYAYDIEEYLAHETGNNVNEYDGHIKWEELEDNIYNFFTMNIKELTTSMCPYTENSSAPANNNSETRPSSHMPHQTHNPYSGGYGYQYVPPKFSYGTEAYKEREAFYDKLWPLIKENKTSQAIDLIDTTISAMKANKKFEELACVVKNVSFDKMNIPTMLHMLKITSETDGSFKERKELFDKVKIHIARSKPSMVDKMLNGLEPIEQIAKDISVN